MYTAEPVPLWNTHLKESLEKKNLPKSTSPSKEEYALTVYYDVLNKVNKGFYALQKTVERLWLSRYEVLGKKPLHFFLTKYSYRAYRLHQGGVTSFMLIR